MLKDNISQLIVKIGKSIGKTISNMFIIIIFNINADKYLTYIAGNGKSYIVTEQDVWNIKMYKWLSDGSINAYIAASVNAANISFNYNVKKDDKCLKISHILRLY